MFTTAANNAIGKLGTKTKYHPSKATTKDKQTNKRIEKRISKSITSLRKTSPCCSHIWAQINPNFYTSTLRLQSPGPDKNTILLHQSTQVLWPPGRSTRSRAPGGWGSCPTRRNLHPRPLHWCPPWSSTLPVLRSLYDGRDSSANQERNGRKGEKEEKSKSGWACGGVHDPLWFCSVLCASFEFASLFWWFSAVFALAAW